MEKTKSKSIIIKLLFSILIVLVLMIIKSSNVQAAPDRFNMGVLDIWGGDGICPGPEPYLFGNVDENYFCANHHTQLVRRIDGKIVVYQNRLKKEGDPYYNEQIQYANTEVREVEQSIAAGFYMYKAGGGTAAELQQVVWASGQWAGKSGYVNNLVEYKGDTANGSAGSKLISRAEDWANLYYNLIVPSGNNKINIDVEPDDPASLRVMVNQPDRYFIQGPYKIDIINSSGASMSGTATEHIQSPNIGTLVYNEIMGNNVGQDVLRFCEITKAEATVKYTDGTTSTLTVHTPTTGKPGDVTLLDENGNEILFPQFGQQFFIKVAVPTSLSAGRTVATVEMDFDLDFTTKVKGKTYIYKADRILYELNIDTLKAWTDFKVDGGNDQFSRWKLNKSINALIAEAGNINTPGKLYQYLMNQIKNSAKAAGVDYLGYIEGLDMKFTAFIKAKDANGRVVNYEGDKNTDILDEMLKDFKRGYTGRISYSEGHICHGVDAQGNHDHEDYCDWEVKGSNGIATRSGRAGDKSGAQKAAFAAAEAMAKQLYNKTVSGQMGEQYTWYYRWNGQNAAIIENMAGKDIIQPTIIIELTVTPKPDIHIDVNLEHDRSSFHLIGTDFTTVIGGKVWEDIGATKTNELNGKLGGEDRRYGGMLVELYEKEGNNTGETSTSSAANYLTKKVRSTITDADGSYRFDKLNAFEKYIVVFTYNGQMYQQTYYKDDLSGGYSNADEIGRDDLNIRFAKIDSAPRNYKSDAWHTAYGEKVKLRRDNGEYISKGKDEDGNDIALNYTDAWNQFVSFALNSGDRSSYDEAYNNLQTWLANRGVGSTDRAGVDRYIKDCMIRANTRTYPVYDKFIIEDIANPQENLEERHLVGDDWWILYTQPSDQSRNVDFGINKRDTADLALQKDVYKATVRVNGKTQTYMYNKKDSQIDENGSWTIPIRQSDVLYNGEYKYNREIRKSEYLYDGTISGATVSNANAKDLQVFVTYRIAVRNQSDTFDTTVNEIVDYYDTTEFTFDGTLNGKTWTPHEYKDYDSNGNITNTYINSYVGDRTGRKIADLKITEESTETLRTGNSVQNNSLGHNYRPIYLSGVKVEHTDEDGNKYLTDRLTTSDIAFVYVTFKVNKHTDENNMSDRIQMDVNTLSGEEKGVGKRNLAEINGYSTYYKDGIKVPMSLTSSDSKRNRGVSGEIGGGIDLDSTVGNLTSQDLYPTTSDGHQEGDLIISKDEVINRTEDDTDKAPNVRLVFPATDDYERVVTGYVYEDERTTPSEDTKAVVGDGKYDAETKVNGVTVQLVELVQNVDNDGIPIGSYAGEYVWNAKTWNGSAWVDTSSKYGESVIDPSNASDLVRARYYSGQQETVSPIICGPGATKVDGYTITEEGRYAFKSIPTGDLFVRFIYGDTTQTTLTRVDGEGAEVANLLGASTIDNNQGYISNSGLNAKSYNGQDYKSTTYQAGIDQTAIGTFNGIEGYTRYDETTVTDADGNSIKIPAQNYNITTPTNTTSDYVNRTSELITVDGTNKQLMYYYNIAESEALSGISDAKDVRNIRENVNTYSRGFTNIDGLSKQTVVNGRAEVLASGLKLASGVIEADGTETHNADKQISMLKEFMNNTAMVAQTGIINTEVEYNTDITKDQGDSNSTGYVIDDVDLGLQERPVSQLQLNKEVTNLKITLANGAVMFDTNKSVTNLPYAKHDGHHPTYSKYPMLFGPAYRLTDYILGNNSKATPELITTYMDEELMYGARLEAIYTFTVTNIGEVDYLDNRFYYTGKTDNKSEGNMSVTGADQIVDYVSNNLQFLPGNTDWSIRTVAELTGHDDGKASTGNVGSNSDLVNAKFANILGSYNNIVTVKDKGINKSLLPENIYDNDAEKDSKAKATTQMVLSTTLVPDTGDDSMVYNNLSEIVQTSNTQGRRMKYSIAGNQEMSDQSRGTGDQLLTKADLVTPAELDADSSQKILILPPTGANRNYTLWVTVGIVMAILIGGSIFLIKKFLNKK